MASYQIRYSSSSNWQTLRANLMAQKRAVYAKLIDYPRQIAGCDIQFQTLSEKRNALIAEMARLNVAQAAGERNAGALMAFIESSPYIDTAPAQN
jgi:hypothetical protein